MAEVVAHLRHQPQTLPRSIEVIIVFLGQARTLKFISTDGKTLQRCWRVFPEFIFKKTMLKLNWVSNGKKTQQVGNQLGKPCFMIQGEQQLRGGEDPVFFYFSEGFSNFQQVPMQNL